MNKSSVSQRRLAYIDGDYVVTPSGTKFPPICVVTDERISEEDMVRKDLSWCSPYVWLFILVSGVLLFVMYFAFRKTCSIRFGLHPRIQRKYGMRAIIKGIAPFPLFASIPFAAATDSTFLIVISLALFIGSIVLLFMGNSPLKVVKHEDGMFWIRGCSREFLDEMEAAIQRYQASNEEKIAVDEAS